MDAALRATVVTVTDEVASGRDEDRAGRAAVAELEILGIAADLVVVADDVDAIRAAVREAIGAGSRVVITCGGTGIGPSDITPEAVAPLLTYQLPGVCEEIRRRGAEHVLSALVSREVAGIIVGTPSAFVLTAPGSRGGVRDAIGVVGPLLEHIVAQLDGAGHV
jgi:molybdenum cofactor synthesis domain-containing protein